jgi:hypothetical protein
MQVNRTRALILCSATLITTGIFVMAAFLFIIFAFSNSSYDSIQIQIQTVDSKQNCLCTGRTASRGKSYFKLEYFLNMECEKPTCQSFLPTSLRGEISYYLDSTLGTFDWHLRIASFVHPANKPYFFKIGHLGISSTDSIQVTNSTSIFVSVNIS